MKPDIEIHQQDYKEGIKKIPEESIDLVLTDIPYNISIETGRIHLMSTGRNRHGLDFGEWDKNFNEAELSVLVPKVRKGGSLFTFMAFEQYSTVKSVFEEAGMILKDRVVWEKTNPMPRNRDRRWISNIELAAWFIKPGRSWVFNRQDKTYERSVLRYPTENGGGHERYHPTQKNLQMIEYILSIHSNPGDLVLDPFTGGGTTAVACLRNNRRFIGFEIDGDYYEASMGRLQGDEAYNQAGLWDEVTVNEAL